MKTILQPNNQVKIPNELLKQLRWRQGRAVYVYPLNEGLTLRAKPSRVLEAAQTFEQIMREENVSLEELLKGKC